jgi:hypothetical protein
MAIKVLELHHQGVRVGGSQEEADQAASFYRDVLGLGADPGRPNIPASRAIGSTSGAEHRSI